MTMTGSRLIPILIVGVAVLFQPYFYRVATKHSQRPVIVFVEAAGGRVTYTIESKPVLAKDMLEAFAEPFNQRGDCPVLVFVEGDVPLKKVGEVSGHAGKVGFTRFHYYAVWEKGIRMSEIKFGPSIPFSTNPTLD